MATKHRRAEVQRRGAYGRAHTLPLSTPHLTTPGPAVHNPAAFRCPSCSCHASSAGRPWGATAGTMASGPSSPAPSRTLQFSASFVPGPSSCPGRGQTLGHATRSHREFMATSSKLQPGPGTPPLL